MSVTMLAGFWTQAVPWLEDPSLLAAPFVIAGYRLGRRKDPRSWLCMAISNALLVAIGALSIFSGPHHVGLFVSAWLVFAAGRNYLAWRRGLKADPVIARLEADLAAARARLAALDPAP